MIGHLRLLSPDSAIHTSDSQAKISAIISWTGLVGPGKWIEGEGSVGCGICVRIG